MEFGPRRQAFDIFYRRQLTESLLSASSGNERIEQWSGR
jgi:hypothetical protein